MRYIYVLRKSYKLRFELIKCKKCLGVVEVTTYIYHKKIGRNFKYTTQNIRGFVIISKNSLDPCTANEPW